MGRTVIVGDLHGCRVELERLLAKVGFREEDRLYFVGDLASRGPDPLGALAWVRRTGGLAVLGNHEDSLLRWRGKQRTSGSGPARAERTLAEELTEEDWRLLEQLPLYRDLPEHDLRIVHAGLLPGIAIERQPREVLLTIRYLGQNGEPMETRDPGPSARLWGAAYEGPPHVVFGHYAQQLPQLHEWATGIDTGAVYGNRLTALVLEPGQKVPPPAERNDVLVSMPSQQTYYVPRQR